MKAVQVIYFRNSNNVIANLFADAARLFNCAARLFKSAARLSKTATRLFTIVIGAALFGVSSSAFALLCSTDSNQPIPDGFGTAGAGAPATITIDFPPSTDTITDLNFQLQLNINWVGDVGVTLTSPAGTEVTLIDRPGRPAFGVFGCFRDNFNVLLDDAAALPAETQCPASNPTIAGTLRPTGNLSDFNGEEIGGTWTVTATDFAGGFVGTLIAGGTCIDETTTPVTLSSFKTKLKGEKLVALWQTSSEVFNLGFNLWGEMDDEWVQLNKRLIPSASFDSVVPQKYRRKINTGSYDSEITSVGISAFSTSGQEEFYGPFEIGEEYGEDTIPEYIDWADQRAKFDSAMSDAGYVLVKGRWRKATEKYLKRLEKQQTRYPDTLIRVQQDGIYQVSYEELLARGIDYAGVLVSKLALTLDGDPVSREILIESPADRRFGPGSKIIFYGTSAKGAAARYVSESIYRLGVQPEQVLSAPHVEYPAIHGDEAAVDWHFQPNRLGEKKQYSITLSGDDPWYDSFIGAFGRVGSKSLNFDLGELDDIDSPARFTVNLFGGLDFTNLDIDGDGELEPDHHYKIYVNRDENPTAVFEGFIEATDQVQISEELPAGILRDGDNQLEIEVIPDNGYNNDLIYLVEASLDVPTLNQVAGSYLQFSVLANAGFDSELVMITDANEQVNAVYSADALGNFAVHEFVRDVDTNNILMRSPTNSASKDDALVWIASDLGYLQVDDLYRDSPIDPELLDLADIDYVVIASASLIGEDLDRFVSRQQELGRNTKVVNIQDIYNHYSSGRELPTAISDYLADQAQNSNYQYVLLVGGHTYNYRGYNVSEENAPINLIPAHYRPGDAQILQVPTAVPFVDFDGDGAPDLAIGRWPVRDLQQLKNVVDKTLAWHADGSHADSKTALLVAGAAETFNDFSSSFDRLLPYLGGDNDQWPTLNRVFMDDINADDSVAAASKVEFARNSLVEGLNQGAALTIFSGHASPSIWGRQSILNTEVAEMFSNQGQPSLMMPLACYASYYETPAIKSLAEQLFTDNADGAVGISSSAVLSTPGVAENMSKMLLNAMTVKGQDLGTAVLEAKRSLQSSSLEYQGFVHSWTTLADPTLSFKLPDISQSIVDEDGVRPGF